MAKDAIGRRKMGSGMSIDLLDSAAGTHAASSINKSILRPDRSQ